MNMQTGQTTSALAVLACQSSYLTEQPMEPEETCKTNETSSTITNEDFLRVVFRDLPENCRAAIVSFRGNPATAPKGKWAAKPYEMRKIDSENNNYFGVSSYHFGEDGRFHRTKKAFSALHCIMLDDVGTKVDRAHLSLPFSWLIETSSGNFQAGYLLAEPLSDAAKADELMKAIINAGLCDPGAGGPTARLARLPIAVNGKSEPAFRCYLSEWRPDTRYTISEIVDGLGSEIGVIPDPRRKDESSARARAQNQNTDIFTPCPPENPVIVAFKAKGLYKAALGDGKHDITCPWVNEHTNATDGGTAYWEPNQNYVMGGFKCLHSHGNNLHIDDLLNKLGVTASAAKMRPVVCLQRGKLHAISDVAEQLLAETGLYYQSAGLIVTVPTDPYTNETSVVQATPSSLRRALSRYSDWERYDGRSEDWVPADPPLDIVSILHGETKYLHLPALRGLSRQPHLRPDGTLAAMPGYDHLTGRFGVFDEKKFHIPDKPSKTQAEEALEKLLGLVEEVAFETDVDKSAAIAAMLTAAARPSLPTAPGFLVNAHAMGSGKSFLNRIITTLATPQNVPGIAFPRESEEMEKKLIALLIKSPAVINFDDMSGDIIPSEALKTALTEENIGSRLLGYSKDVSCSTRVLFLFSGNNIQPTMDMSRRILTIHLDPGCEAPATREFKRPHLEEEARRDRSIYISAALTIIRGWNAAGSPRASVKPIASYNGPWSDWCRHPLLWLGLPDPADRIFEQLKQDPDVEILGRILTGWHSKYGTAPKLLREVLSDLGFGSDLHECLLEVAGDRDIINTKRLGWWLRKQEKRIVSDMKFVRSNASGSAIKWKVEVSQVLKVSGGGNSKISRASSSSLRDWECVLGSK